MEMVCPDLDLLHDLLLQDLSEPTDLRDLLYTATRAGKPFAMRYPRGQATGMDVREGFEEIPLGTGRWIADGEDVCIVSYGAIGNYVGEARQQLAEAGVSAAHVDLRFVKPIDAALLTDVFSRFSKVLTVEDGVRDGGAGSAVVEWASDAGMISGTEVVRLGLPDTFIEHGSQRQLHDEVGIGPDGIAEAARQLVGQTATAEAA